MILGMDPSLPGCTEVAERCSDYLSGRGRKNVHVAYHKGSPGSRDVMESMFHDEGIDTFCILPLCIAEGQLTIWNMPASLHLPNNSGSWTMIGDDDVATRFATAMGADERIASEILRSLPENTDKEGVVIISYGSKLSQSAKTSAYYRDFLRDRGWDAECCSTVFGTDAKEAVSALMGRGRSILHIIPLMISSQSDSFVRTIDRIKAMGCRLVLHEAVTASEVFYEIMDEKVPEGW